MSVGKTMMGDPHDLEAAADVVSQSSKAEFASHQLMLGDCPLHLRLRPNLGIEELSADVHWFWQTHPRITFIKCLIYGAVVIDLGAGNGAFFNSRTDYLPGRPDQMFYALDLFKGEHFDQYDDYQVANFENEDLKWADGSIDAVMASHVLEHLQDDRRLFDECYRVLRPGGLIYVETPSAFTGGFPTSDTMRAQGLPMVAANFFEDDTHVRTISNEYIASLASLNGFIVQQQGVIRSDYFADALIQYAQLMQDQMFGMFGFWSKTGWAQFLVLRKPDELDRLIREM